MAGTRAAVVRSLDSSWRSERDHLIGVGVFIVALDPRPQEPFLQNGIEFLWRELAVVLVEYFLDLLAGPDNIRAVADDHQTVRADERLAVLHALKIRGLKDEHVLVIN